MVLHIIWDLMTIEFIASVIVAISFGVWVAYYRPKPRNINSKHVMITGGSSGIGKQVGIQAVRNGANVSIIARNPVLLEETRAEIQKHVKSSTQKVSCFSVDVSGPYECISQAVAQAEEELGPVFLLVNCAGYAKAARFEDTTIEEIQNLMNINYLGAAKFSHAVIPGLKGRREGGIVLVSSQAGLSGIYGFAAYSSSKFALRGLGEALSMELKPYNITVTMVFPPDTDTPGLAKENEDKPEETKLISQASSTWQPDEVAKALLSDSLEGKFMSTMGIEGFLQSVVCTGMSPVTSFSRLMVEVVFMGIARLVSACYLYIFDGYVRKCMLERNQRKRSE